MDPMNGDDSITVAVIFVWFGMVVAISFLEAPLKLRARRSRCGSGSASSGLVFRALNTAESVLAVAVVGTMIVGSPPVEVFVPTGIAVAALIVQLVAVRPRLTGRSDAILTGAEAPRSHSHHVYIGLETAKSWPSWPAVSRC